MNLSDKSEKDINQDIKEIKQDMKISRKEQKNMSEWETLDIMARDKVEELEEKILSLSSKIDNIEVILMQNRTLYTNFIKENHEITKTVVDILRENRRIYLDAFDEVEHKEDENIKALKPILEDVSRQNEMLKKNMSSPFLNDRLHYRYWRSKACPGGIPNIAQGISGILSDSPLFQNFDSDINQSDKNVKRRV